MKILSWNVNGLSNILKRKKIKEVTLQTNPDVALFQKSILKRVLGLLVEVFLRSGLLVPLLRV